MVVDSKEFIFANIWRQPWAWWGWKACIPVSTDASRIVKVLVYLKFSHFALLKAIRKILATENMARIAGEIDTFKHHAKEKSVAIFFMWIDGQKLIFANISLGKSWRDQSQAHQRQDGIKGGWTIKK